MQLISVTNSFGNVTYTFKTEYFDNGNDIFKKNEKRLEDVQYNLYLILNIDCFGKLDRILIK